MAKVKIVHELELIPAVDHELSPELALATAIAIAAMAHRTMTDKGGKPYILHPLKVMHYLHEETDMELMAAAVLHDVLEDTDVTAEFLQSRGLRARTIELVLVVTKDDARLNEPGYDDEYYDGILQRRETIRIKKADLRHNLDPRRLKGISDKDHRRMQKYNNRYHQLTETEKKF